MTLVRHKEVVEYFNICKTCGNKFLRHHKDSTQDTCDPCRIKRAHAHVKKQVAHLIGAKVINIEPVNQGTSTYSGELESIEVETAAGKRVLFSVGGRDGFYIKAREVE